METWRRWRTAAVLAVLAGAAQLAAAHDFQVKSLKGEAIRDESGWHVTLRYDVRIKHFDPNAEYEIILYVLEDKRPIQNAEGQSLQQVVTLRNATVGKKGDGRFTGEATGDVPAELVRNIKHLKVKAVLFIVGQPEPLADKQTGLKVPKK